MRKWVLILCLLAGFVRHAATAQDIRGKVLEKGTNRAIEVALVRGFLGNGELACYAYTDEEGKFLLKEGGKADSIQISCLGYENVSLPVSAFKGQSTVWLSEKDFRLKSVTVTAQRIVEKEDTLVYSVAGFAMPQDKSIADVLSKMPGIEVRTDGRIEYNGTAINKFYIEGMDLMGNRYTLASNNLDRKKVKSVEILRNHQPVAVLRGKSFSEQAAINLVLEDNAKLNLTGTVDIGLGYNAEKELLLHDNRLLAMMFKKNTQNFTIYKSNDTGADIQTEITMQALGEQEGQKGMEQSILAGMSSAGQDLPQQRYLFNQSHLFATNHLQRTGKNATLRAQVSYFYEDAESFRETATDYLLSADSVVSIHEEYNNRQIRNQADASLCYEVNSEGFFLKNTLSTTLKWQSDRSNVYLDNEPMDIWVKPDQKYIQNNFEMTVPVSEKNTFSILSSTSYNGMPQRLLVLDGRVQEVDYQNLNSYNQLGMHHKLFGFYLKSVLGMEYHRQRMETGLQGSGKEERGVQTRIVPSWTSTFTFRKGSTRIESSLKLKWWNIDNDWEGKTSRLLPEWSLFAKYDISATSSLSARYNIVQTYQDLRQLYRADMYTDYRSIVSNRTELSPVKAHTAALRYEYVQPLKGLFVSLMTQFNYQQRKSVARTEMEEGNIYIRTNVPADYGRTTANVSARVSKSFAFWKSNLSWDGNYIRVEDKRMNVDQLSDVRQEVVFGNVSFSSKPARWLSVELGSRAMHSRMSVGKIASATTSLKHSFNLFFNLNRHFSVQYENNFCQYLELKRNVFFSDFSASYQFKNISIEAIVNNLFGKTDYQQDFVSANFYIVNRYILRPRDFIVKVAFGF